MNPDVKALWVDALRSGKYDKGRGYLKYSSSGPEGPIEYCCLGVLCEVSPVVGAYVNPFFEFDSNMAYLPLAVSDWAGLEAHNPKVPYRGGEWTLADINDDNIFVTFDDIALLIEEHL